MPDTRPDLPTFDVSSWDAFERTLAERLAALPDDAFVSVAAPAKPATTTSTHGPAVEERRGGLRRLLGRGRRVSEPPPVAYTQARQMDEHLYVECVGSRSFGGDHDWSPGQEEALVALGWIQGEPSFGLAVYLLQPVDEADAAPAVARAMTATMRQVCAVPDPARLDVIAG